MVSNISDEGDENYDEDNDDGNSQAQEKEHEEIKDSESSVGTPQSSQSSSRKRVHTPAPILPKVCVTPGKWHRIWYIIRLKRNCSKLLKNLNPRMMKMKRSVCIWLQLWRNYPSTKERAHQIKWQQSVYNCLYGPVPSQSTPIPVPQ